MSERLTYTSGTLPGRLDDEFERRLGEMRAGVQPPFAHFIAGESLSEGRLFERRDPSDPAGHVSRAHAAEAETVAEALSAARGAQAQWSRVPYEERCAHMRAVADEIGVRQVELASVVSLETGKTRMESIAEVQEAIDLIETYSSAIEVAQGFVAPLASLAPGEHNLELLRPYGVFGVIAPFNFPLALAVNMLSAALIAGNTVVLKPSEATPWTGALLGEVLGAGGLPAGVFNLVHGGADTGRALVAGDVAGIAFTGSVPVGREIARTLAGGAWARPVLAEMGGKNPAIVTAGSDLEKAAEGIARAAFGLSGQKCSACSRAIVSAEVHDELLERLCVFTSSLSVGDPSDRMSALGPVIDARAVARFQESAALARRDGRIAAGGAKIELRDGYFVEPTVVTDLPPKHPLNRRELFLPFLTVTRVDGLAEAIAEANAIDYGLSAGIFSEDQLEVEQFLQEIEAGVVYVNRRAGATTGAWPGSQSFCGWKASGLTGKGGLGPYYLQQFMREQSRTIVR
ncbi:MAG TPA: aldehyde dehydrogenase family protein [Solirubrobacteraceae bacterium]|jgi:1-pyrroline-5-carboxylate dehydrogenase|nr:aldehyde dehydrogenase family protein [Solirubrobacteraceae bacterium]